MSDRPSPRYFSIIALKCALWSGAAFAVVALVAASTTPSVDVTAALLGAAAAAVIVYGVCAVLLVRPIRRMSEHLSRLLKHRPPREKPHHPAGGDELERLEQRLQQAEALWKEEVTELRSVANYRREFLGNVSHELKTPIFAVKGFAETLRDGALEDPAVNRMFVEKILRNAERLSILARDLTEIARLETGELTMDFGSVALPRLVQEVVEALEYQAREREVTLRQHLAPDLPPVIADRERLRQVLVNLVDNAIKYNAKGGHADVRVERAGRGIRVAVVDDGIGIAEPEIPRLTERFYRVDRSRSREQGGTGLGLAIVKHILAAHRSQLEIESRPGEGSRFSFVLPLDLPSTSHAS